MSEIETLSLLFDSAWYLTTYQDVAESNCDPLDHYLAFGYREGRNPNRFFNTNFYLTTYSDLAQCPINPFIHYILYGASEGRLPRSPNTPPLPGIRFDIFYQEQSPTDNFSTTNEIVNIAQTSEDNPTKEIKETLPNTVEQEQKSASTPKKKTIKKPTPKIRAVSRGQKTKKV